MFSGRKSASKRREQIEAADRAVGAAMSALACDNPSMARKELSAAPKTHYADMGWKVDLALAMIELHSGKRKQGTQRLIVVCSRLDDTSLGRDDKNYLRLYALYRASEASKDGKPPFELRDMVEDFSFDHTMISPLIRKDFPLKKLEESLVAPPPLPPPPPGADF